MLSEFDFIKRIRDQVAIRHSPDLVFGIGDDAAVLREQDGRETLVTVDLLIEDVDFKLEYAPPRWLGHKALAVSLSDVAAMGAAPAFSLLTLGVPKQFQISNLKSQTCSENLWNSAPISPTKSHWFEEFFDGYFALAEKHSVILIGGDISSTPDRLTVDSVVIGHCQAGKAVRRDQAQVGDAIYLTGSIGASAAGLKLLLGGARVNESANDLEQSALRAHLRPEPRVAFGRRIGELGLAHSMIDVSDGLAQDLAHICEESKVAAIIDFDSAPVAEEVSLILKEPEAAFEFAVTGGEDLELLLTASRDNETRLFEAANDCGLKLSRIGEVVLAEPDRRPSTLLLRRCGEIRPLSIRGFDHFLI
jgi:thiamine-monophosphate kinase